MNATILDNTQNPQEIQVQNITLGQVSTAVLFIVALIGGIEFLALRMRKYITKVIKALIDPMANELKINTLNTLKCTMCNKEIPLSERLEAGKIYIEKGGNGGGKIYYHKLADEYEKKLKAGATI